MKLISCDNCGLVYDQDKITFPEIYDVEEFTVIEGVAEWDGEDYVPIFRCTCGEDIRKEE